MKCPPKSLKCLIYAELNCFFFKVARSHLYKSGTQWPGPLLFWKHSVEVWEHFKGFLTYLMKKRLEEG